MRALIPSHQISSPTNGDAFRHKPSATRTLLRPLLDLTENSDSLIAGSIGEFVADREVIRIPRFIFMGPKGGGDIIRIGTFATIRGDEPEGAPALIGFLRELEITPETAKNFNIHAYPICNPSGFAARKRDSTSGVDLTDHFWRGSTRPEIYYLEREMGVHRFHGVITLHTGSDSSRFHVSAGSPVLNATLAEPAIDAAHKFLPGTFLGNHTGAASTSETSDSIPHGFLTVTEELHPTPFEIHIHIPRRAPKPSQNQGAINALKSILDSYRTLIATRQNI